MQKSARLRVIFRELREVVGSEAPAGDLIRLANLILRSYTEDIALVDEYGRPSDRSAFLSLEVDEAMKDGGWRILAFEDQRRNDVDKLETAEVLLLRIHISKYLGAEWRQELRTG